MSTLRKKIYANIVQQLTVAHQIDDLQRKMRELELRRNQIIGGLNVLSEFYQEEEGTDLQQALNNDPYWKGQIEAAQAEVTKAPSSQSQVLKNDANEPKQEDDEDDEGEEIQPAPQPQPAPPAKQPAQSSGLKRVQGNKNPSDERKPSVRVVIDDSPPEPPANGQDDND